MFLNIKIFFYFVTTDGNCCKIVIMLIFLGSIWWWSRLYFSKGMLYLKYNWATNSKSFSSISDPKLERLQHHQKALRTNYGLSLYSKREWVLSCIQLMISLQKSWAKPFFCHNIKTTQGLNYIQCNYHWIDIAKQSRRLSCWPVSF